VTLELRVVRGARAGQREQFAKSLLSIGRNPVCDFRFDPQLDLDVSSKHAEIEVVNGEYILRDNQSTNGTFVNGTRITATWVLRDGDVVMFGAHGPQLAVRLLAPPEAAAASAKEPALGETVAAIRGMRFDPNAAAVPRTPRVRPEGSTAEKISLALKEHTRDLRRWALVALLLIAGGIGGAYWLGGRDAAKREAALAKLRRENDSLAAEYATRVTSLSMRLAGLDSSLAAAHDESESLQTALARAGHGEGAAAIANQLSASENNRRAILTAAMNYPTIFKQSGPAVTLIAVEWPDGRTFSGTGFGVSASGVIVTNRHLLADSLGRSPKRVAVIFSDTKVWLRAHVVRVSRDADLALLQIEGGGRFPVVTGVARSTENSPVGSPVAIIGYPLGTETPMEGSGTQITARSTLAVGTVAKHLDDVIQMDASAWEGSSGSPVFATDGNVIGIVYGGAREAAGRIVYAVPAEKLAALLAQP